MDNVNGNLCSPPLLNEAPNTPPVAHIKPNNSGWWVKMIGWLYKSSNSSSKNATLESIQQNTKLGNKSKSPFTKLSSFKFHKELGKGAFGRVLLAEAKIDGKLYALKIISKKDMRTSDRRQAKAERDILLAMANSNSHPFTTGLKFAFQSAHNLYLGMDYFPGGNLKELIKKEGYLKEVSYLLCYIIHPLILSYVDVYRTGFESTLRN